ncbi:MAG: lytic transglycosylase domain-containing protein [Deltaproteobacteria bacterium]|nr:lytic transglycosylase domain-containing protein [Deltaproteobacteria bacterium]
MNKKELSLYSKTDEKKKGIDGCLSLKSLKEGYCRLGAVLCLGLAFFLLSSCSLIKSSPERQEISERLKTLDEQLENAKNLRVDALRNMEEALLWGSHLASVNPDLTTQEIYQIGRAIVNYSELYNLSPSLIVAVIKVESHGKLKAVSPRGARGLMQVMPLWRQELGIKDDLFSIDTNIKAGCFILSYNIAKWGYKEGILRYYRGSGPSDDGYFVKVQRAMSGLAG